MTVPRVAVVLAAYRSHETIADTLQSLRRQTYPSFTTVVVDSSPDHRTATIVEERFPEVRLVRSAARLLPQAARNLGVQSDDADLLAFTDPDVVAEPGWLAELVRVQRERGGLVCGALACHGQRPLHRAIHLCKFSSWMPGGPVRRVDSAATANLLLPRALFDELGGFPGEVFQGDTVLSWRAVAAGHPIWLAPRAVVHHRHTSDLNGFLRERLLRGLLFGHLRAAERRHGPGRNLLYLAASVLPVRLVRILGLTLARSARARSTGSALALLPLVALGHGAFLLGESRAYARLLAGRREAPDETRCE